jgi:GMP synthase (glutamine-hydrolysing)
LFKGMAGEIVVWQAHTFHVPQLPHGFDLLASTDECPVQAMKHKDKPVYGVQFQPETYDDAHPDGKAIITNFFRLAQAYHKAAVGDGPSRAREKGRESRE